MHEQIDCLLVHTPKFRNYYPLMNSYSSTSRMSQSLLGLADSLAKVGFNPRVLHIGVQRVLEKKFDMGQYVADHNIPLVGFSMHWHQQITDVIMHAELVKKACSHCFVFLGGVTASYFAEDILNDYPFIDGVLTGEAEGTISMLAQQVLGKTGQLGEIPNLVWRSNGKVRRNEALYQTSESDLSDLSYTKLEYLENYPTYVGFPKAVINTRLPIKWNYFVSKKMYGEMGRIWGGLVIGRGCYVNCFYCGGGQEAQRLVNNRHGVAFRSHESVISDIQNLVAYGYTGSYVSFDPRPHSQTYYIELFEKMIDQQLNFTLIFSCWDLPTPEFISAFAHAFNHLKNAKISVSPETGSERLRKISRGRYYTNDELLQTLNLCEQKGVSSTVFFSLGIPRETRADFEATLKLNSELKRRFKKADTTAFVIELEPASPWYVHPEQFGIKKLRKSLRDFIVQQNDPKYSPMYTTGYLSAHNEAPTIESYEQNLLKLKCNNFCDQKNLCYILKRVWSLSNFVGVTTVADKKYQAESYYAPDWRKQFEG